MLIKNVKIANYDAIIENADIEIKENKIFKIMIKKGEGKNIVIPGFIDQHIHGFLGHDAMDGASSIEFMSEKLPQMGTTAFLPTVMTSGDLEKSLVEASQAKSIGSRIVGIHSEGPYLSIAKKGAHDENFIIKATKAKLENLIKLSNYSIRKMTIAPENFDIKLLPTLFENNIIPSIGHTDAIGSLCNKYFKEGTPSVTHLWNAMRGVKNREPGLAELALINPSVMSEMILDFIHVDQDTAKLTIEAKGVEGITLVTDSITPAGLPDGPSTSGGLEIIKKGNLITLKGTETIAGSGATMLDNFKNVLKLGYDLETAVSLTSFNASLLLGEENIGVIRENYLADLVILNKDYQVVQTIVDGKVVYDQNIKG